MRAWKERYGRLPSYDWSRTTPAAAALKPLEQPNDAEWPPASVVGDLFGTWEAARTATAPRNEPARAITRGDHPLRRRRGPGVGPLALALRAFTKGCLIAS